MRLMKLVTMSAVMGLGASCCVARGTRVRTRTGERLVESLEVGDEVVCVDPSTSTRVVARLSAIRTSRRECLLVSAGARSLACTTDHPLYDPLAGLYADAGDWALGKRQALLEVPEDEAVACVTVGARAGLEVTVADVFDLTVDHPLHNFVANGLLVHNKSPPRCNPDASVNAEWCLGSVDCTPTETAYGYCNGFTVSCACRLPDGGTRDPLARDAGSMTTDGGTDGGGRSDGGTDGGP